jgi:hypothetical protein
MSWHTAQTTWTGLRIVDLEVATTAPMFVGARIGAVFD